MKESAVPEKRAEKVMASIKPENTSRKRGAASGASVKTSDTAKDKSAAKSKKPVLEQETGGNFAKKRTAGSEVVENPAKKTSKKTSGASKTKKSIVPEPDPSGAGSRTPQVMKLVQPQGEMVNPVIIAGKSRIPQQLRGRAPLSRIMRREAQEIFGEALYTDPNELLTVDLTELVIKENAGELLRRFNACCCDKCIEELSRRAADKVPSKFVQAARAVLEQGAPELEEQKEPLRKSALSAMIRELIGNKRRHFHNV